MKPLKEIAEELIYMDTIRATETKWLWYPYIPFGKITVIQGDPGEGKTTLILNIAARLTQGILPQSQEKCEPMNVIYQTAEDGLSDTVKPRLLPYHRHQREREEYLHVGQASGSGYRTHPCEARYP